MLNKRHKQSRIPCATTTKHAEPRSHESFNASLTQQAAKAQAESASTQKAEREVTRMVVVMVLGFLVCWTPYTVFSLWVVNNRGQTFDLRFASIPAIFSKSSAVYNPIIYVLLNKQVS